MFFVLSFSRMPFSIKEPPISLKSTFISHQLQKILDGSLRIISYSMTSMMSCKWVNVQKIKILCCRKVVLCLRRELKEMSKRDAEKILKF
jgi:hypothetical protein